MSGRRLQDLVRCASAGWRQGGGGMSAFVSITIDDKKVDLPPGGSVLEACRAMGIKLPVLCDFKGLGAVGACRLCLVEIEGIPKLLPTCTTPVAADQIIRTESPRLAKYRRMIVE